MDKDKLDVGYREQGWGKITDAAFGGRVRPSDVEAGARIVAQYASDALAKAEVENDALWKRIRDMSVAHDARVTELLAANNREVERRREAERLDKSVFAMFWLALASFGGNARVRNRLIQGFDRNTARIVYRVDPDSESVLLTAENDRNNPGMYLDIPEENGN